jgi:DNA replication ATP-dependent helicase Dna2
MPPPDAARSLLADLRQLVVDERAAALRKVQTVWRRPLAEKLASGWTQRFSGLERGEEADTLWARPDEGESRFRQGDLLVLHAGDPGTRPLARSVSFELEEEERWLLRGREVATLWHQHGGGPCFADPDALDLTPYYERALDDIATSPIGTEVILPLLLGTFRPAFDVREMEAAEGIAAQEGCNVGQAQAVGMAYGADSVVCIQGPPGSGKTRVLGLLARLMVGRGERLLVTSHTHLAINNALNKVFAEGIPVAKVGRGSQRHALADGIACVPTLDAWTERPTNGYVVGATPFATCNGRIDDNFQFDAVLVDEASQVTVPLALLAMRKGSRFIFLGDQRQLPPVLLSRSVLAGDVTSIFAHLTGPEAEHAVMLEETYRMNRWLTAWPSRVHYGDRLRAEGPNRDRRLTLSEVPARLRDVLGPEASAVFVPTLDRGARTRNRRDAELVADLCGAVIAGGLAPERIGVVTPYRAQAKAIRNALVRRLGPTSAGRVVADTVERLQGQERELVIVSLATGDEVFLRTMAGFLFQPERLNVSVTRAMTKLVLIGPRVTDAGVLEDQTIRRWIAQYMDLVAHCQEVVI